MDVRELPARPNPEHYKKQAKDLLKACRSGHSEALWRIRKHQRGSGKSSDAHPAVAQFLLADAQFAIAREHGFGSWPKFAKHLAELTRLSSPISNFEAAADAIVAGDLAALKHLLRQAPGLVRARSSRTHASPLLHYVAGNGVEDYRQKTPANAVAIAKTLLDAGVEVDAA